MSNADPADLDLIERLKAGIANESLLEAGRILPERRLAEELGIGRTRLRRILDQLERDSVIFRHHGQGTFPAPPPALHKDRIRTLAKDVTPHNVMEVRLEIEPALSALAAQRATGEELRQLGRLLDRTIDARDPKEYDTADEVFHFKIAELAHNPLFLTIYQSIRALRRSADWTEKRQESHSVDMIARLGVQHQNLFQKIEQRQSAEAARHMEEHLLTVSNVMLRTRRIGVLHD
ncbi:FadR/GntR family transcriptional regulator [Qingshengfaniella alkalisoli]|uniref:FadR family transcriptional regulator n=1 Tax=Qingshengfaniella alkalisoli TaxID=2599296 RepID=A0A5B8J9I6_9RHOB|nr:FCD domain-containing protein [Qingshengfaniella alkalisoli]QDY70987.1 FadR family transcriptional regulator [Qingshengfaniella alkalisoli]